MAMAVQRFFWRRPSTGSVPVSVFPGYQTTHSESTVSGVLPGIGSAVTSAVMSGAAVVLPAVGGIKGCGDPKQRAGVTVEVLHETQSTLLFADTHIIKQMPAGDCSLRLRGGQV